MRKLFTFLVFLSLAIILLIAINPVKADLCLVSGMYSPTLTGADVANLVDSPGLQPCQYLRVGSAVTVSCLVTDLYPVYASTITQFYIHIPVNSAFSNIRQCAGTGVTGSGAGASIVATNDIINYPDRCLVSYMPNSTSVDFMSITFTYLVQ